MKKLCLLLLFGCFAAPVDAVPRVAGSDTEPQGADSATLQVAIGRYSEVTDAAGRRYRLRQIVPLTGALHSLSLEIGAFAGLVRWPLPYGCGDTDWNSFMSDEFPGERRYYEDPLRVTPGIGISYGFRVKRWFETGVSLTYLGYFRNRYFSRDRSPAGCERDHYVTLMPYARFSWLNRRSVRLYSSLHLGVQWNGSRNYYGRSSYFHLAAQVTPFGIRVGRRLFGYGEIGIGMRGVVVLGVGYGLGKKL